MENPPLRLFLATEISMYLHLPSGNLTIAIENGPVEIVDFPIKNCDFP